MPFAAGIYYQAYGTKESERLPVILIHGAGGTHLYWPPQVRRLAGCRVYALDLPGHGRSGGRGCDSIPTYAESVLDWLAAVGLSRAIFVGHSMGSAIGLTLALDFSGSVLGLGLLGSAPRLRVNPELLAKAADPATFPQAVDLVTAWSYCPTTAAPVVGLAAKRMAEGRPSVLYGDFQACAGFDVSGRLGEVRQPALVICGEQDRMTPLRQGQLLASALPAAHLAIIPNAGHMVMIEQPGEVGRVLEEFVSEIGRKTENVKRNA